MKGVTFTTYGEYVVQIMMEPESDPLPLQLHSSTSMCQTNFLNAGFDIVDMKCDSTLIWLAFYQSNGFEAVTQEETDQINHYTELVSIKNNAIPPPLGVKHTAPFGFARLAKDFLFKLSIGLT